MVPNEVLWLVENFGPEFGKDTRKTSTIDRALYGLKSAGASFRSHLARCMESLGYESCKSDPDLLLKPEIKPEDGVKYYFYQLCMWMTFYVSITMQMSF